MRMLKERGVDFIKVQSGVPRDAYFAIADEASRLGIPFEGHVPDAIRANVYPRLPNSERATLFVHRDLACAWTQLTTDMAALCSPGTGKANESVEKTWWCLWTMWFVGPRQTE